MERESITLGLADLIPVWLTLPRSPKSSSCSDAKRKANASLRYSLKGTALSLVRLEVLLRIGLQLLAQVRAEK